jgi:excisionase family DNA binding protein
MVVDLDALLGKAYSVAEVAELLGVLEEQVRRLIRANRLKAHRPPGRRMYVVMGESIVLYLNGDEPTPAMKAREAHFIEGRLGAILKAASGPTPRGGAAERKKGSKGRGSTGRRGK